MNQKDYVLSIIANMSGQVVTDDFAVMARDLVGQNVPTMNASTLLLQGQLLILLLQDLGGSKTIPLVRIDNETRDKLMKLELTRDQTAIRLWNERKIGSG